ncbi:MULTISPECIES: toxin [unclassified Methyloversatilis]|uniref:toxin n=1 Tax=unclassified Methyloversatilis TaxID=2639971 RepID=UPI00211B74A9|nr:MULTISPECIES: toxin [unclassified Methyloversatilis]MCQ9376358.1 toxin [Methyloversatilis sp. XJ19-13]MCQ9377681.1 toxin [Methyloversatilis sp. XJ19-49]
MKPFRWSPEKNGVLKEDRGVSFESMVVAIEAGGLLDILAHPNEQRYPRQRVLVVAHDSYAYLVPFVEEDDYFFLKTVIPSRKATRDYLNQGDDDAHQD